MSDRDSVSSQTVCGEQYPKTRLCISCPWLTLEREREVCNVAEREHHVYGPGLLF